MTGAGKETRCRGFLCALEPYAVQTAKKVPEAEQLAPVGVQRYGRARVATEVKILAKQAELQQNHSMYVILRNEVTKNLFAVDTAKILRVRSG